MENFNFIYLIKEALLSKRIKIKVGSKIKSTEIFDFIKDVALAEWDSNDRDEIEILTMKGYSVKVYISENLRAVNSDTELSYFDLTCYFANKTIDNI